MFVAIDKLRNAKLAWVSKNTQPKDCEVFTLSLSLFKLKDFQQISCGSKFGEISESVEFLLDRDIFLRTQEEDGYIRKQYCRSGFYEDKERFTMWYESTSGMVLRHRVCKTTHTSTYLVSIPSERRYGSRHQKLEAVLAGATASDWKHWDDFSLKDDDRAKVQAEWDKFYSKKLVPLGFPSLKELEKARTESVADRLIRKERRSKELAARRISHPEEFGEGEYEDYDGEDYEDEYE